MPNAKAINRERSEADRAALRKLHQTIGKITNDFDSRWHFNTVNRLAYGIVERILCARIRLDRRRRSAKSAKASRSCSRPSPPYTAQDLWAELGHNEPVFRHAWPTFDAELAKDDLVEIPVQVNGKLRGHIHAPHGASKEEIEKLAFANEKVKPFLEGKQIVKIVVVPDRLVNIVVK